MTVSSKEAQWHREMHNVGQSKTKRNEHRNTVVNKRRSEEPDGRPVNDGFDSLKKYSKVFVSEISPDGGRAKIHSP
jgi:hypothetical protein